MFSLTLKNMKITLDQEEFNRAIKVGELRQSESTRKNLQDKHGLDPAQGLKVHVEGACGELAVSKALGVSWDASVNTFKKFGDLGDIEVRTASKANYCLIVRQADIDSRIFILAIRLSPREFDIIGWILGSNAKKDKWLKAPNGREKAWFVPQDELLPIDSLKITT